MAAANTQGEPPLKRAFPADSRFLPISAGRRQLSQSVNELVNEFWRADIEAVKR